MTLDIDTPRGRESLVQELEAVAIFNKHRPDIAYSKPPEKTSPWDAELTNDRGELIGIVETKCRPLTQLGLEKYFRTYERGNPDHGWIVTYAKLEKCIAAADSFHVPLFGFLYVFPRQFPNGNRHAHKHAWPVKTLMTECLYAPGAGWLVDYFTDVGETQATINGGIAIRQNAFIDMRNAQVWT